MLLLSGEYNILDKAYPNFLKLPCFFDDMTKKQITNFALNPDEATLKQFKACYSKPYVVKASLMPDAHLGYVAPIGAVLVTRDYLVPSWVGYDIGCGMTAVRLPKNLLDYLKKNRKRIYENVKNRIPMGLGQIHKSENKVSEKTQKAFFKILSKFEKNPHNKQVLQFLKSGKALKNLGTLGHGNHFIEIDEDEKGFPWIVVHSGSRAIGHWIATFYMKQSSGKNKEFEATYPLSVKSEIGKEYQNLLEFGLEFAKLNRVEIIYNIIFEMEKIIGKRINYSIWTNKNHNHAIREKNLFIHRKGATPAKKGERGIIPANMKDGSFLVEGKGSKEFLSSSSHGAGRALSRSQARKNLNLNSFKNEMQKAEIIGNFSEVTLDEAPQAYKNIYDILKMQKESIKVISHLKPFINWKGEEKRR